MTLIRSSQIVHCVSAGSGLSGSDDQQNRPNTCASVIRQYNLVPVTGGWEVNQNLVESKGMATPAWTTGGLTAQDWDKLRILRCYRVSSIPERVKYKLGMLTRRCLLGKAPVYLSNCCIPVAQVATRRRLRSAARHQLTVPRHRLSTFGRRAFAVAGPTFSALPDDLYEIPQ